ncbi:uncharacterized protein YALI1_D27133g [Yarrowia lipolytica]|uniref:Uncharacterized protein n=1 Tax=Yarrowia lipolytica TaxID=4952 RepID=A0A1D8NFK6_YARLL|nr:hypothetical protein YALI1_D27133g [Yarrowia lipolytica]
MSRDYHSKTLSALSDCGNIYPSPDSPLPVVTMVAPRSYQVLPCAKEEDITLSLPMDSVYTNCISCHPTLLTQLLKSIIFNSSMFTYTWQ